MTPSNKIPKKKLDTYRTFLDIRLPQTHGILTELDKRPKNTFSDILLQVGIASIIVGILVFVVVSAHRSNNPIQKDLLQEQRDRIHSEIYK